MNLFNQVVSPVGRGLLALIFIASGAGKISAYAATQGYMGAMGVPGELLPLVILTEVGGGLALLLGWQARIAALALAGFSLLAAVLFHNNFEDQIQMIMFMKNLSIAGGLLFVAANGAGPVAMDNRRS